MKRVKISLLGIALTFACTVGARVAVAQTPPAGTPVEIQRPTEQEARQGGFAQFKVWLQDPDVKVRHEAVRHLINGVFGSITGVEVVPLLMAQVQTVTPSMEQAQMQDQILEYIGYRYRAQAAMIIPRLQQLAADPSATSRRSAIVALGNISMEEPTDVKTGRVPLQTTANPVSASLQRAEVVPTLAHVLESTDLNLGQTVVESLRKMRGEAWAAVPALTRKLNDKTPWYASQIYRALGQITANGGTNPVTRNIEILKRLPQVTPGVASAAFQGLAAAGKEAAAARPVLMQLFQTRPEAYIKLAALQALGKIGPGSGAETVTALLTTSKDASILDPALGVLRRIDPADISAVAPLVAALGHNNPYVRAAAAEALSRFGPAAAPATPVLLASLRNIPKIPLGSSVYEDELRAYLSALIKIGPATSHAADTVIDLLDPKSSLMLNSDELARTALRAVLLYSLVRLGLPEDNAKQALLVMYVMQALGGEKADTFLAAATIVAVLGVVGKEAVPLLMRPLRPGFAFDEIKNTNYPFFGSNNRSRLAAPVMAIRALGKLGPMAAEALPTLNKLANGALAADFYPTDEVVLHNALITTAHAAGLAILRFPATSGGPAPMPGGAERRVWEQWFPLNQLFDRG